MPNLTPEQSALVDFVATHPETSVIGDSVAGSGKTTTGVAAAAHFPPGTIALAFNKKNREDFKSRMPEAVESHTFNSLGHKVLFQARGGGLKFDPYKTQALLKGWADSHDTWDLYAGTRRAIELAKQVGYCPPEAPMGARSFFPREEFLALLEGEVTDEMADSATLDNLLRESIHLATAHKTVDYGDQVWLPIILRLSIPKRHTIFVDEAQDLSPLQHEWLRRLVAKRLIAMGDPFQAIYGWRGADCHSLDNLRNAFQMETRQLTWCFRCPEAVIREAQTIVPHIQAAPGAAEGTVTTMGGDNRFSLSALRDEDTVLCRNNAPIHSLAIKLLLAGIRPNVLGSGDMAYGLANFPKNQLHLGGATRIDLMLNKLEIWKRTELDKAKSDDRKSRIHDRVECIELFAAGQDTVEDYRKHVLDVLKEGSGRVTLSTIHKAKGLEWSRVFFLDRHLIRPDWFLRRASADELQQSYNLEYVAMTRAESELIYCNSADLKGEQE